MGSTMRAYWASQIFLIWLTLLGVVGVVCADVLGDISCHNGTIRDSMTSGHVYCTLRAEEHGNQAPTSLGSLSIESYEDGKGDERRRFFTLLLGHGDVGRQAPLRSGFASLFQYFGPPHEGQYSQSKITSSYINWVTSSYRQSHGVTVSSVGAEKTNDASTSATSWWTLPLRGIRHGIVQMKRLIWSGICYPWWRPTAMYDIFAQREIHIQFPIVNVDGANSVAGRAAPSRLQIFRTGRLQRLRLISYLPVPQSNILPDGRTEKTIFHCDVNAIREAHQWMDSRQVRQSWQDVNTDAIEGDGHVMDEAFPNEGDVGRSIPDASSLPKWMLSWLRRRTSRVSRDAEWMTDLASKAYLDHVVEELGPHAAPPSPSLLRYAQRLTGRRILRTLTYLAATDDDEGTSSPRYVFHFSASLPAVSSICFSMEATASSLRLGGSGAASHPLDLEVTVDTHLHWSWLQKLLLFGIIVMAFPQMEQSRILHVIFAGFFGMFVLTVLCISYIFRSIQKMSVGKAGVLAILIAGGVTAVVEGVVSASAQVLTEVQDQYSQDIVLYALILVLLLSLLSSALIRCLVPTYMLHVGVKGCLYLVIALLLGFLFAENREATVVTMGTAACVFIIAQVSRRWMPPSTRESGPWKRRSLQMIDSLLPESSTARWKAALKDGVRHAPPFVQRIIERCGSTNGYDLNGEPDDDDNPRKFAAVAYATPIVEEGRHYQRAGQLKHGSTRGANDRSRNVMQQYEKEGAEHTRLALEQLAAHLRSNPGRYADRLRDPNGVQRWAGEADTESDTSDASD